MDYQTIYCSRDADFGVCRTATYLHIRANDNGSDGPVYISIPNAGVELFVKNLTDIANAPAWTRARFIRVTPHIRATAAYTMARVDDEAWVDENGTFISVEQLLRYHVDIEVIA